MDAGQPITGQPITGQPITGQPITGQPITGHLILVATPIGNLGDVSTRMRTTLAKVAVIAAEDTRRTRQLLSALDIPAGGRLVSFHEHNERTKLPTLLEELRAGRDVAVVTDAGTPAVSDPGQSLVQACITEGIDVTVVPGPSAVLAALIGSGLPTDRFVFEGFPPRKGVQRRKWLDGLTSELRTIVIFEAPSRVRGTLRDLAAQLGGDRRAAICRELSKLHEEYLRGTLAELSEAEFTERGEIVLVVEGADPVAPTVSDSDLRAFLSERLAALASVRDATDAAVRELGVRRNRAYSAAMDLSLLRPR